jgi:hypothetical protein
MPGHFNIQRVEYIITKRCTGWCEHCSVMTDNRNPDRSYRDFPAVLAASDHLYSTFPVTSMMVYGGEPLLYPGTVADLLSFAREKGVARRELITNGYFSKDPKVITSVARHLLEAGVSVVYLSVDAFHQARIPLTHVEGFLSALLQHGFEDVFLHPSWVVRRDHDNEHNGRTHDIIDQVTSRNNVRVSTGNNIIPAGFFRHHLSDYYPRFPDLPPQRCSEIPYANSPERVGSLRFLPNGDVHICRGVILGNVFETNLPHMLDMYDPALDPSLTAILTEGVQGLLRLAINNGLTIDPKDFYGRCDLCAQCLRALRGRSSVRHGG